MSSNVFANTENPEAAHVLLETTAGDARTQAPGPGAAEQIDQNVDRLHTAAQDAAKVAKVKGTELTGEPTSAVEQLQAGASHITTNATLEGEKDVESAKAAGASILEQVKNITMSTVAAVQSYLPENVVGHSTSSNSSPHTEPTVHTNESNLRTGVNSVAESAKQYAQAAQDTAQLQMKGTAQGLTGTTGTQGVQLAQTSCVPAISAPLESGLHTTLGSTYPPSATAETQIGANEPRAPTRHLNTHRKEMDSFMNLAKQGLNAYTSSQSGASQAGGQGNDSSNNSGQSGQPQSQQWNYGSDSQVRKTGGQEYNSPHHSGQFQGNDAPDINHDEIVQAAQNHGSGHGDIFSGAVNYINNNKQSHNEPINDDHVTNAHQEAYHNDNARGLDAGSLGAAAAMQALKKFTSGGGSSGGGGGGMQSQLISMAMGEASKLFDKSGGTASGNKQDAVNGAAMTVMKMMVQSKFSGGGTTGGSNSGGLGSLMGLASKFM
ncbi:hypothetical protein APHAL10511_006026 [Amanita phalloides]|nr:hypothetical protein APHAL10511_006026 [Amanita phalloides]